MAGRDSGRANCQQRRPGKAHKPEFAVATKLIRLEISDSRVLTKSIRSGQTRTFGGVDARRAHDHAPTMPGDRSSTVIQTGGGENTRRVLANWWSLGLTQMSLVIADQSSTKREGVRITATVPGCDGR